MKTRAEQYADELYELLSDANEAGYYRHQDYSYKNEVDNWVKKWPVAEAPEQTSSKRAYFALEMMKIMVSKYDQAQVVGYFKAPIEEVLAQKAVEQADALIKMLAKPVKK